MEAAPADQHPTGSPGATGSTGSTGSPGSAAPERRFVELTDADGTTRWRFDAGFLTSRWRCLWGNGCQGIHDERRPELQDGCCSVGVVLADADEAMRITALAATLDAERFEHAADAADRGVLTTHGSRWATSVVEGACVFLNRPGFAGGAGCALHLAALAEGDPPLDWKPQTCSRMPLHVDERVDGTGATELTVRPQRREDWGPGGATMAWWCVEADEAYTAEVPVVVTLRDELADLLGEELLGRLEAQLDPPDG